MTGEGNSTMAETHIVGALTAKRSEVAGAITDLEHSAAQQRGDLVHVDAVLRLYAPSLEPDCIRSRAVRGRNGLVQAGRTDSDGARNFPVCAGSDVAWEIGAAVMTRRGLDPADMPTVRLISKLVNNALSRQAGDLVEKIVKHRSVTWRIRR
jgi:hypothetical protein